MSCTGGGLHKASDQLRPACMGACEMHLIIHLVQFIAEFEQDDGFHAAFPSVHRQRGLHIAAKDLDAGGAFHAQG
jgi:hypothetical protein